MRVESKERGTMIQATTHVPIVVSDQDRALDFYTRVLGFEKRQDYRQEGRPRWLTVAPEGQDVELILVQGRYALDPRPPADAGSGGNHHVFSTDDCRRDIAALTARGLRFKDPAPVEAPYGTTAYFTDPDGNHFALLESRRAARAG
jgi:catechol 2,3-dioxygenase-like lactoylglutathione lyase family enzyme